MVFASRKSDGQTMVEAALALPFLLFMLVGLVYFGRYFFIMSVVNFASQQGAMLAASTPNLQDPSVRDLIRGFSPTGQTANQASVIYNLFASASLLTGGKQGNLPAGSQVLILPYDQGTASPPLPAGAVAVQITYPFQLLGSSSGISGPVMGFFSDLNITQQSAAFPLVYQEQ